MDNVRGLTSQNPVIFDSDGSIIFALYGIGASNSLLGFDQPLRLDNASGIYLQHWLVLNGRFASFLSSDLNALASTVVHEIGHLIGLDHSQLHQDFAFDTNPANNDYVPMMFPIGGFRRSNPLALGFDDQVSVSTLYPAAGFSSSRGTISGTIYQSDGVTPFQGANMIVEKTDDPFLTAATSVSGYLYLRNGNSLSGLGSSNSSFKGFFKVEGLPPGQYRVKVEEINYLGPGSTVGPISFRNPLPGPAEYYSGNESNADNPNDFTVITVSGGVTSGNRNIVLNSEYQYVSVVPLVMQDVTTYGNSGRVLKPEVFLTIRSTSRPA